MQKPDNTAIFAASFIFMAGISATGLFIPRHHGWMLLFAYFTSFFGYFWLAKSNLKIIHLLLLGLAARLVLFAGMPSLSDDVYRFIWDGALLSHGMSPYERLPVELLSLDLAGINDKLYTALNSQHYYSVYPPLNQLFFWLAGSIGDSWLAQANALRTILLLADLGSVFLLVRLQRTWKLPPSVVAWFFLNPLLILESTGNLHFEGLVIFFLLLGLYHFEKHRSVLSGIGFGMAIATKLLPLIYLPAILLRALWKKGVLIVSVALVVAIISLVPFLASGAINGMQSSLELYFQKFEFNASVYFVLREVGYWLKGYNTIGTLGPWLSWLTFLSILGVSFYGKMKQWPLPKTMLLALSIYLLLATTVHPWYILPLIPLGLLSGFFYPLVWSLMAFVTYFGYQEVGFELSPVWIVLEYVVVFGTFGYEIFKNPDAKNS